MSKTKLFCAMAIAVMTALPGYAADEESKKGKKGKGRNNQAATQLIKQLEPVGLTEEQTAKIKEMGKAAAAKMKELQASAGLTPEILKKRIEAQKSMKDSGKKGKELAAAVNEAAGLSEAHIAAFKTVNEARMSFQREVIGMLTDEQKGKLPERLARFAKPAGKKGKKKKDAA